MNLKNNFIQKIYTSQSLVILFFFISSLIYLLLNKTPAPSDSCYYFVSAAKLTSFDTVYETIKYIMTYPIPPLLIILPFLPFKFIGVSLFYCQLIMMICYTITAVAIYGNVAQIKNKQAALTGLIIFASTPIVFGMAKTFMTDTLLTMMIALSLIYLKKSNCFTDKKNSILFGLFTGLSLLSKSTAPIFLIMPVIFSLRKKSIHFAIYAALTTLCLTLPWYGLNFINSWVHFSTTKNTATDISTILNNISSIPRISLFCKIMITEVLSTPIAILFPICMLSLWKQDKNLFLGITACVIFPSIFFLALSETILARYLMPINIFIAAGIAISLKTEKKHYALRAAFMAIYLSLTFLTSFDILQLNKIYPYAHTKENPHTAISYGNLGLNTSEPLSDEIRLFLQKNKPAAIYFITNETSPNSGIIENILLTYCIENKINFYREGNMFTSYRQEQPFSFSQKKFHRSNSDELIIVFKGNEDYAPSLKEFNEGVGLKNINTDKRKSLSLFEKNKTYYRKIMNIEIYGKILEMYQHL